MLKRSGPIYNCRLSVFNDYSADELKYFMETMQDCPGNERIRREDEDLELKRKKVFWTKTKAISAIVAIIIAIIGLLLKFYLKSNW